MKALWFNPTLTRAVPAKILSLFSKSAYWSKIAPLIYGEVPVPELPSGAWVLIKNRLSGICGSDMTAITLKGSLDNPLSQFISLPMFLGHEIVGEVAFAGDQVDDLEVGERVAIYPILSCAPRGISPPCPFCEKGDLSLCQNLALGDLPPGQGIGTNNRTGGGFSEYLVAHRSQVFRIPDSVSDQEAVLLDPLGVALHAVLTAALDSAHRVLVIGAGIIGLSVIQIIRALNLDCIIHVVARHPFQKQLALRCGAVKIIDDSQDPTRSSQLAEALHARQYASRFVKPFFMGGFEAIFDCVGTANTLQKCLGWANHRGKVVLVGASPSERFEWSLLFWKELQLLGSMSYGLEKVGDTRQHAFDAIYQMVAEKRLQLDLFPVKTYPLADYRTALKDLTEKGNNNLVKVAFDFRTTTP